MKFNEKSVGKNKTLNYEGEVAYKLSPKLELYSAVVTSSLSNKFYESKDDQLKRIITLINRVNDPEFVAKLAVYTREKMYLRSIPLVLTCELAKINSGNNLVRRTTQRVIQRADELTEILSYYALANKRKDTKKLGKLSKQLQLGIADAFNKFNEYQFAKYNRKAAITLKDALFLTHPKAKTIEQQELFTKIVNDTLEVPLTWEVEFSRLGQNTFSSEEEKERVFKEKWEKLIEADALGYMALMRNLRNILEAKVSAKHVGILCKKLKDKKEVRKSKQLPFRFLSAYKAINDIPFTTRVTEALEEAIKISIDNVKGFDDNTRVFITCDTSGSMSMCLSDKSEIIYQDIAMVLGMLLRNKCAQVITSIFGEEHKVINLPQDNILNNVRALHKHRGEVGHSTNGYKALKYLYEKDIEVDKVCMFTDCQLWNSNGWGTKTLTLSSYWKKYSKKYPNAKFYLFDLAGYGNTPLDISNKNVFLISGWSEKVFEIADAIERGSSAVEEIEKIVL